MLYTDRVTLRGNFNRGSLRTLGQFQSYTTVPVHVRTNRKYHRHELLDAQLLAATSVSGVVTLVTLIDGLALQLQ